MVSNSSADQTKMGGSDKRGQKSVATTDVQSYLISRYREALKSGDKSFAKSCLLSTRLFSVNDPNITNEIYVMAKSDGDVSEAAKCFANIFQDLFIDEADSLSNESSVVANQMKEEMRLLLNELKGQYLKLKSTPNSTSSNMRQQAPSVCQSPLLSPRLRMSSEDRSMSRDSVLKLDNHLNYTNKSFFYQQLFDNLPQDVRRNVLSHAIDSSDNPFERCRLMMLTITLFNDSVTTFGPRLLRTLMDLSELRSDKSGSSEKILGTSRVPSMCQYARSMLVLDATPLVFSLSESQNLDFDLDELFQQTISYYSEFCLENVANEYEFEELHEGLKKTIAARILAKEMSSSPDDTIEENLIFSMKLLFDRFIHVFSDDTMTAEKLVNLRQLVTCKSNNNFKFKEMKELIASLELEHDIPESILFSLGKDDSTSGFQSTTATPPPKSRGRPKKVQPTVIVSPDDGIRRHLQNKTKEALFVFVTVLQYMFSNCSKYLRQTRSRILINFDNPLATAIECEILKSQRSSRSKNYNTDTGVSPSKRLKTDVRVNASNNDGTKVIVDRSSSFRDSPLNSEQSKRMDQDILKTLEEVHNCMEFLSTSSITFSKLWQRFLTSNQRDDLKWVSRIQADCMLMSNQFESAIDVLNKFVYTDLDEPRIKKERTDSELSTLTVSTGALPSVEVVHLRALAQLISCYIQIQNREKAFNSIDELMGKIKQSGLLANDENYSSGNIIDEYRMIVSSELGHNKAIGFLFFDSLSLIRYVVDALMDILKRYVTHPNPTSDTIIGHTIVLSQIDWPKESQIYERCIAWIRASKPISTTPQCISALTKFTYPDFFHYILDPNILEDFMALLNDGFTLDIKDPQASNMSGGGGGGGQLNISTSSSRSSGASSARSGKAITTRGVNKTFKDDLKIALIAQMKNSSNFMPLDLVSEFIQTSLVPFLRANNH